MSSQIRITKAIKNLVTIRDAHSEKMGSTNDYTRGIYNGIELCLSILGGKTPDYEVIKPQEKEQDE